MTRRGLSRHRMHSSLASLYGSQQRESGEAPVVLSLQQDELLLSPFDADAKIV